MGCATSVVKFLIFLFNFVFVAGGVALVAFGGLFYYGYTQYKEILPDLGPYGTPPLLMIIVGSIVFVIAFLGCCGTIRESKCMMMTYATVLLILLIAEIGIVAGIYYKQDELKSLLTEGLDRSLAEYEIKPEINETWNLMQSNLECCGVRGSKDWVNVNVPASCCMEQNCTTSDPSKIWNEGCSDKIFSILKTEYGMYAAAILAAVELLGVVFGCCLGARFGRKLYHT